MSDNLRGERVVERLQRTLLQVDVTEIIIHEADEPNIVVTACGRLCLHRKKINISTVFRAQHGRTQMYP
jgi:hypothetical protein